MVCAFFTVKVISYYTFVTENDCSKLFGNCISVKSPDGPLMRCHL